MDIRLWIQGMRSRTLLLSVVPVIAAAMAMARPALAGMCGRQPASALRFAVLTLLCMGVAMFIQAATNLANDYSDGLRGIDDERGVPHPADGSPQRLVAGGLASPRQVLMACGVCAAVSCVCGLAVTIVTGHWWFIGLGALCLLAGWYYVGGKHPYGYYGWGEASVFVFFGLVDGCGTAYALADHVPFRVVWMSVAMGLSITAVLSVNNLRDIEVDGSHGKRTWMVRLGPRRGLVLTGLFAVGPAIMAASALLSVGPGIPAIAVGLLLTAATLALSAVVIVESKRARFIIAFPCTVLLAIVTALGFGCLYLGQRRLIGRLISALQVKRGHVRAVFRCMRHLFTCNWISRPFLPANSVS